MGSLGEPNGHIDLPKRDSPDLQLVVATPEENIAQQHANSTEWRGALSLEQYLRREEHLSNQELTKDDGLTAWMLVYQPDGNGKRQVLCGCETIKKEALVSKQGKVEDAIAHGVCSVFCPPEFRGKGYAGRMIAELGKALKDWQTDGRKQVLFSVLFSDIGKDFYAARGWQPFPSTHVSLPAANTSHNGLPAVRTLKTDDLAELCLIDEKLTRNRLARSSKGADTSVALVPDRRTVRWHHAREEFVARELFNRYPEIKGAVVGEPGSRVWCYWTRVWTNPQEQTPNTLHILRLVIEDEAYSDFTPASSVKAEMLKDSPIAKAIAALFAEAQRQAAEWDMNETTIWNPTSTTLAAAQLLDPKATVEDRQEESITSLRWYGEGSSENVDWICNEKYGWC